MENANDQKTQFCHDINTFKINQASCEIATQTETDSLENVKILTEDIINLTIPHPTTLVLSGGSVRGFGTIGALSFLHEFKALDRVTKIVATSVGAIIGTLLAIGYEPFEMYNESLHIKLGDRLGDDLLQKSNILSLLMFYGLFNITDFLKPIYLMIHKTTGIKITLQDIENKYGKTLVFCTYDITDHKIIYLSPSTHPDLLLTDALAMTCCLPLLFKAYSHKGHEYIDGGLADVFPISWASQNSSSENKVLSNEEYILGINLSSELKPANNIVEHFYNLFNIPVNMLLNDARKNVSEKLNVKIVDIDVENVSILGYDVKKQKLFDIYDEGYQQIKKQISTITKKLISAQ